MIGTFRTGIFVIALGVLLAGCQSSDSNGNHLSKEAAAEIEIIESSNNHSHADDHDHDHDHDDHDHEHSHDHDEEETAIYKGYFEDSQVLDRTLADWEGDWQSVYSYLLDGTLDEVFAHKAADTGTMTAAAYKEYYDVGYKTDTERIVIVGDTVTFYKNGKEYTGKYQSDGYEILTYEAGNRGVRFVFKSVEAIDGLPRYIQFSDHRIAPIKSGHFHLYWGDDRDALLKEVTNWPTYYPTSMDGHSIAHEMIAH
ncbi:metal-binding protein ZinT [Paenibacillus sp. 1011MAR3C5]|uniref:metal-binding protein ZinT n=1 Tax=Paenibacillus sp. 1011MAR3C5 TaxID=1675787 RepID=UPI000E6B710E|nr:metal-binding protein ZinT [Paenibacillus sp. 1011MAR3C5]RJE84746.1 metal-binding protein ZinT [Paenibacillus sp. 1011MAR3C5]